jgi:hypothetical protein
MGLLSTIEEKLGNIVESPFKGLGGLDTVELFVALKRAMDGRKKEIFGRTYIPNSWVIIIDEAAATAVAPFLDDFSRIICARIGKWAKEMEYEMSGQPRLEFVTQDLGGRLFEVRVAYKKDAQEAVTVARGDREEEAKAEDPSRSQAPDPPAELIDSNTMLVFPLDKDGMLIGRESQSDIAIADAAVSRKHAWMTCTRGKWAIEDLGSRNGTRVNHRSIQTAVLHDGDKIQIGSVELVFRLMSVKVGNPVEREV